MEKSNSERMKRSMKLNWRKKMDNIIKASDGRSIWGDAHTEREIETHQYTTIHPEIERILIYYTFITARISMANEL